MKKRTAFIGALLSLIQLGQPLLIKTGVFLSTTGLILSLPEKANADTYNFYLQKAINKSNKGETDAALAAFTMAIEIEPMNPIAYEGRGYEKYLSGDQKGGCVDWQKALSLGGGVPKLKKNFKTWC